MISIGPRLSHASLLKTPAIIADTRAPSTVWKKAILDGNHPLAGTTLHFDVEVTDVREATEEEPAQGAPTDPAE